ncbi:hypothetical protein [Paraburkholderia sp.]|uniref:hypothetical protein n=1 Tax=Paraburkholderia sp. TaxID=1926495 RepID=UPI0023972592|nr:hypothetical protein [Paraburkholderia sp.]MDE1183094.1 hypothetical protein [Paraburkholderia sp.]
MPELPLPLPPAEPPALADPELPLPPLAAPPFDAPLLPAPPPRARGPHKPASVERQMEGSALNTAAASSAALMALPGASVAPITPAVSADPLVADGLSRAPGKPACAPAPGVVASAIMKAAGITSSEAA